MGGLQGMAAYNRVRHAGWDSDDSDDEDSNHSNAENPRQVAHKSEAANIISRLPHATFSPELFSGDPHPEACPICMENFAPPEEAPNHCILLTPCLHAFHEHCLKGWLDRNHLCPSCRWDLRDTGEEAARGKGHVSQEVLVRAPAEIVGNTFIVSDDDEDT